MPRTMEKLSGQIKPARRDAILFLSNVIRLNLNINSCKYKVGGGGSINELRPEVRRDSRVS